MLYFITYNRVLVQALALSSSRAFLIAPTSSSIRHFTTTSIHNNMNDEVSKAHQAAAASTEIADTGAPTVFDKILSGEWSSTKVYEDTQCLAFRDITPQAPVHILVIPKHRNGLTKLSQANESHKELLGHLMYIAQKVGKEECPDGFRVVINDGADGAQSVFHLHLHVLGGRQMKWPPG